MENDYNPELIKTKSDNKQQTLSSEKYVEDKVHEPKISPPTDNNQEINTHLNIKNWEFPENKSQKSVKSESENKNQSRNPSKKSGLSSDSKHKKNLLKIEYGLENQTLLEKQQNLSIQTFSNNDDGDEFNSKQAKIIIKRIESLSKEKKELEELIKKTTTVDPKNLRDWLITQFLESKKLFGNI